MELHARVTACFLLLQALIDRPDVVRRVENFKRLTLTDFKVDIHKLAKKKDLTKALDDNGKIQKFTCIQQRNTC